jgi:hypothetical protein
LAGAALLDEDFDEVDVRDWAIVLLAGEFIMDRVPPRDMALHG